MTPFTTLTGIAAPLPLANVDTDAIMPKQFLKTVRRTGLGKVLFYDMRFDAEGAERPEFILNQPRYRNASILVAGANFGCGSSREHAPWGLLDFGIRCVIAPSFADIFADNCTKNGILCIAMATPLSGVLTVNLPAQTITTTDGKVPFDIDPARKETLVSGLDEIGLTLTRAAAISRFEVSHV